MDDLIKRGRARAFRIASGQADGWLQSGQTAKLIKELCDEIERLQDIIDCGCNAIRDAVAVSGGDLVRINAVQKRMRREALDKSPKI